MKKIPSRFILAILAIPLFFMCGLLTTGEGMIWLPSFLLFLPVHNLIKSFAYVFDNLHGFRSLFLKILLFSVLPYLFAIVWFYLIGISIDLFSRNIEWKKARKYIFFQLALVAFALICSFITFPSIKDYLTKTPLFAASEYWIVFVTYFLYLIFLIFITIRIQRVEEQK